MSVRFSGANSGNNSGGAIDHNSLLNKGTRSHQEIDEHLSEIDEARSTYATLPERLNDMEQLGKANETAVADHETRIADMEPKVLNHGILIEDHDNRLDDHDVKLTAIDTSLTDHEDRLSGIETELEDARGEETSLKDRLESIQESLDDVKSVPLADLAINAVTLGVDNVLSVTVNGGYASINGVIVAKADSSYSFAAELDTVYYLFLKTNGTFTHSMDSTEPDDAIILGAITVGATSEAIYKADRRYFLTKTESAGNFKELQDSITATQEDLSALDAVVVGVVADVTDLTTQVTDLNAISEEVVLSRTDKDGVAFDKLPDRLNNMQSRLEVAESRGTVEHQSVFRVEYPPDIRPDPVRIFTCPSYAIGADGIEVLLDGIRVAVGEDYVEYSETEIRFSYDIPVDSRVTILSRGSIVNTYSVSEYEYHPDGRVKKETVTGGINRVIDYEYDTEGNLLQEVVTESNGQIKTVTYEREGGLVTRKANNGAMYLYLQGGATYDDRVVKHRLSHLEDMDDVDVEFGYDPDTGLIISESIYNNDLIPQLIKLTEFSYNLDGTVDTETVTYDGRKVLKQYSYDSEGNIIGVRKRKVVV